MIGDVWNATMLLPYLSQAPWAGTLLQSQKMETDSGRHDKPVCRRASV